MWSGVWGVGWGNESRGGDNGVQKSTDVGGTGSQKRTTVEGDEGIRLQSKVPGV